MNKLLISFFLLLIIACHSPAVFEKYEDIPDETWNRYNVISYTASIPDSGLYNIKICLRHTTDYEMANLWCFIRTRSHAGKQLSDTVNFKIAEPDGRWLGKGGTIKTTEQPINRNPVMLPKGDVIFRIEQGMRTEDMKGIKNVGIKIEKADPRENEK